MSIGRFAESFPHTFAFSSSKRLLSSAACFRSKVISRLLQFTCELPWYSYPLRIHRPPFFSILFFFELSLQLFDGLGFFRLLHPFLPALGFQAIRNLGSTAECQILINQMKESLIYTVANFRAFHDFPEVRP